MIILCVTITTVVTFLYRYPQYAASQMVWNTVLWSIYVLLIPAVIMSIFGGYFLNYIKGDSSSNSNALNIIFDFANLFGFIKRFLIQIVRYILITVKIGLFLIFMEKGFVVKRRMAILNENYNIPTNTFDAI